METDANKTQILKSIDVKDTSKTLNVIPNILCQHADAAAALAQDRFYALQSSDYSLSDLKKLESRLEANLDGLFISGNNGWPHYKKHLSADDYGEIFTNTILAIKLRNIERFEFNFETAGDDEELLNAIADAFIWLPYEEVSSYIDLLYKIQKPEKQFVAIAASAGHRLINIDHLKDALTSTNVMLRHRALFAAAELGKKQLAPIIKESIDHEDENIRFAACWALTRFGDISAMEMLKTFLTHPVYGEKAVQFEVMQKDINQTSAILRQLFQNEDTKRLSIYGVGLLGNPNSMLSLIRLMEDPELARVAGESFTFMTGVDLAYEDLDQDAPEDFEGGPNDNPKDENVDMDPDEDLPWPNPVLIAHWWQENKAHYHPDKRYILGEAMSFSQFKQVLIHGTQKQRTFAALSIATRQQDQPIFNVCAPAKWQAYLLGLG